MNSAGAGHEPTHFAFVDALRGLAFLAVVIVHVVVFVKNPPWILARIGGFGQYGVQLFYVASALTLMLSCQQRIGIDRRPMLAFFIRRIFRILPMYWVAAGAYLVVHAHFYDKFAGSTSLSHLLANLTFVHAWYPEWIHSTVPGGWSVGVEMSFYLLLPALFFAIRSVRGAVVFFAASLCLHLVTATAINELVIEGWGVATRGAVPRFSYYWFPAQLPVFALGIVLYFMLKERLFSPNVSGGSHHKAAVAMTLAVAILIGMIVVQGLPRPLVVNWSQIAAGVAALCFAYALAHCPWRILVNPCTRYLGKISYSGYLCHYGIVQGWVAVFAKIDGQVMAVPPWLGVLAVLVLTLATTLAVSTVTYRWIEQPGIALGKQLIALLRAGSLATEAKKTHRHGWTPMNTDKNLGFFCLRRLRAPTTYRTPSRISVSS